MTNRRNWQSVSAVLRSLGWPLLVGMGAFTLLTLALHRGLITDPTLVRYLTSHWVSYVASAMFCVGMASLSFKAIDVARQYSSLNLDLPGDETQPIRNSADARNVLTAWREALASQGRAASQSYLARRIDAGLEHVVRRGSPEGIDEELKYMADTDANEQHESYSLVRIVTWATPMLGFLGTVIGISDALGNLTVGADGNFDTMLTGLKSSLYVAFDTTAQALTLSIILMFVQFIDDRFEKQLLGQVDVRTNRMLLPRMRNESTTSDPVARSIERSSRVLLEAVEGLVERQATLWSAAFQQSNTAWETASRNSAEIIENGLKTTVNQSIDHWQHAFGEMMEAAETRWQARWEQLHLALSENARRMQTQQQEFIRHGEIMERTVVATGEIVRLETALERNLDRVAGAGQFEEAILNLSAAIQLLNGRLTGSNSNSRLDRSSDMREKSDVREKAA